MGLSVCQSARSKGHAQPGGGGVGGWRMGPWGSVGPGGQPLGDWEGWRERESCGQRLMQNHALWCPLLW